jgi:hypothetical protein
LSLAPKVLDRANTTAIGAVGAFDASDENTYEAKGPDDRTVIVAQLQGLVNEHFRSVGDGTKKSPHHITFHSEFDRMKSAGLYQLFLIDPRNPETGKQFLFHHRDIANF